MIKAAEYISFLSNKHKNQKTIDERVEFINQMQQFLIENSMTGTDEKIGKFFKSKAWSAVLYGKLFSCMEEYVPFIKDECNDPEAVAFAEAINSYMQSVYLQNALNYVEYKKKTILLIPDGVKINPIYLGELDNDQFVTAFRALQQLVINIYTNIYNSPFDWGYPDFYVTDGYYNRLNDILLAIAFYGTYNNGILSINSKDFSKNNTVKCHKNLDKMFDGFQKMGFVIENFNRKSVEFEVSYPENPHILYALKSYAAAMGDMLFHFIRCKRERAGLSYRFVEDPAVQEYETIFHAITDYEPVEFLNIQRWLHAEATKCGFTLERENSIILYKKGSKDFLIVGCDNRTIVSKVIFRKVFETHKEKIEQLALKFPETFIPTVWACGKCRGCVMSIKYEISGKNHCACAYLSFLFKNLTMDNIGELLELYKIENKIK